MVTAIVMTVTIHLGQWQGERAAYKEAQQRSIAAALTQAPLTLAQAAEAAGEDRYRRVQGKGRFLAEPIWFLDNRVYEGRAGYAVLQLFEPQSNARLDRAGRPFLLLVDRGWVPMGNDRRSLPSVTTPEGLVEITGRLNRPASRHPGSAENTGGPLLNYVALDELERMSGRALAPMLVELTAGEGWLGTSPPVPSARIDHHYAYRAQWYSMAALAFILFLIFSFRKVEPPSP